MFGPESRVVVVVGAQWGDEGKGKLVDVLAERPTGWCAIRAVPTPGTR
jgi:adenylosuccinate synthase